QGIAVTPIQMIRAMAVIASGGEVMVPQIVDKIGQNGWEEDIKPEDGERVISEKAAQEITDMMVAAVKNGESKWTAAKGFKIAGKTGTAQIPVQGHYDEEKTIASFVGFAPADNPKFIMLVTLREPTSSPWGSETAAPLWFNIARQLFPYLGIQPES
ncbi:MAG: Peptidoglycan glycosyltransferase, partial [Candidatus Woesebacteria bacterium GW2011_GWB1_44_11b]